MGKKNLLLAFALVSLVFLVTSCGYKEGIVQGDPKSYFWFTGNTENAVVYLNDLQPIELSKSSYVDESGRKVKTNELLHYQVKPGRYRVVVKKGGSVVVDRDILVGDNMTKEISIP